MMEDRQVVAVKMEDPSNAVEFRDVTLAWEKARPPAPRSHPPPKKQGGMMRVLRREKLSLYIPSEDSKGSQDSPNTQSLLTNMEQESPQSTISSTQSIRPPLHKTLHRIDLRIKKVKRVGVVSVRGAGGLDCYMIFPPRFQGSLVGICGSVGSGKSSLLSALLGQVTFSSIAVKRWGRGCTHFTPSSSVTSMPRPTPANTRDNTPQRGSTARESVMNHTCAIPHVNTSESRSVFKALFQHLKLMSSHLHFREGNLDQRDCQHLKIKGNFKKLVSKTLISLPKVWLYELEQDVQYIGYCRHFI